MQLSYKIAFPDNLVEVYNFLQDEYNRVLSNEQHRKAIMNIDTSIIKGEYWKQLRLAIGDDTQYKWKQNKILSSPSWYFCAFAEQIRQMHKAQKEQVALYNALQLFNNQDSDDFRQYCNKHYIKYSTVKIKNCQRCKSCPELPANAKFVLDFAFINSHACHLQNNTFHYSIVNDEGLIEWCELPIIFHQSSKYNLNERISKPKFSIDKDGNYYGVIAFDYTPKENNGENVGAIDLGQVNLYTFSSVQPDGTYSKDYFVNSKMTTKLQSKVNGLYDERNSLLNKNKKVDDLFKKATYIPYNVVQKWQNREQRIQELSSKITRIKEEIASQMATEIVELCEKHNCGTLFMEKLNWLESIGGKWNHSEQQDRIELACTLKGIDVYKVDAKNTSKEHPITKELGKPRGRDIVWSNGDRMDRDRLSTLNQLQRTGTRTVKTNGRKKKEQKQGVVIPRLRTKDKPTPTQMKRKYSRRKENLARLDELRNKQTKRATQMVVVLPRTSEQLDNFEIFATWSCVPKSEYISDNSCFISKFI